MQHGRDHQERQQKAQKPRNQNLPQSLLAEGDEDAELEAEMLLSGRKDVRPAEGLVGPHTRRADHATTDDDLVDGSNYAPTAVGTERERERHRQERKRGYIAAGTEGNERGLRVPGVTADDLEEAAHEADEHVRRK